jgi:hypothetical protein
LIYNLLELQMRSDDREIENSNKICQPASKLLGIPALLRHKFLVVIGVVAVKNRCTTFIQINAT